MRPAKRRSRASTATRRSSSATCSATARELGAKVLATGHYVASRALPAGGRALYRALDEERDQSYFLFATTREQLEFLRFPLGDRPQGRDPRACPALCLAGRRQARQPGHLLRSERPLCRRDRAAAAGRGASRRDRRSRRAGARAARRRHQLHGRPAARPRHCRPANRFMSSGSMPPSAGWWSGRARRCAPRGCGCAI